MLTCEVCGCAIAKKPGPGRNPRYCSNKCRNAASYARKPRPASRQVSPEARSRMASDAATARWKDVPPAERAKHAAALARARWGDERKATRRPTKQNRECRFCGISVAMSSNQITCGATECRLARNAERMREGGWMKARRARETTTSVEVFTRIAVYERDGWVCGICKATVDPELKHPDPMSASLDHVVALSNSGTHTLDNVQCAHLRCNIQKGNRERKTAA